MWYVLEKDIQMFCVFLSSEILDDVLMLQTVEQFDLLFESSNLPLLTPLICSNLAYWHLLDGN